MLTERIYLILLCIYSITGSDEDGDLNLDRNNSARRKETSKIIDYNFQPDYRDQVTVYRPKLQIDDTDCHDVDYEKKTYAENDYLGIPLKFDDAETPLENNLWTITSWEWIHADYLIRHNLLRNRRILSVNPNDDNLLESTWFVPDSEFICLSLMYLLLNAKLTIRVQYKNGLPEYERTIVPDENEENKFVARTIIFPYESRTDNTEIRLLIQSYVAPTSEYRRTPLSYIYNMALCDSESSVDIYVRSPVNRYCSRRGDSTLRKRIDSHNQRWDMELSTDCYPGITGVSCNTGCEENRFGRNCSRICSETNCSRLLFCSPDSWCYCASGFTGYNCNEPCQSGLYGPDCIKRCGYCNNYDSCDIYTGNCLNGCRKGYYPPLCKDKYKYLSLPPVVSDITYTSVNVTLSFDSIVGIGEPIYLKIFYKQNGTTDDNWSVFLADPIDSKQVKNLTYHLDYLQFGHQYTVKTVLVHSDGEYNEDVPSTTFWTKCDDPKDLTYNLKVESMFKNQTTVVWNKYEQHDAYCFIWKYDIYLKKFGMWEVIDTIPGKRNGYTFNSSTLFVDDYVYLVKIRAVTNNGPQKFSFPVKLYYNSTGISVNEINVISQGWNYLHITWKHHVVDSDCNYYIFYRSAEVIPCSLNSSIQSINFDKNNMTQCADNEQLTGCWMTEMVRNRNHALIKDLKPFTKYYISIVSNQPVLSDRVFIATTNTTVPTTAPQIVKNSLHVTNDTVQFQIVGKINCTEINGFFRFYQISLSSNNQELTANVTNTSVAFYHLNSNTRYEAKIYYVNNVGINPSFYGTVIFQTRASQPSTVQSLVVYKKSHRTLTLRWKLPENATNITGFIISWKTNRAVGKIYSIEPKTSKCIAWPDLFCHTIDGLIPRTRYDIEVRIKTEDYENGGLPRTVSAVTMEEVPENPQNLTVTSRTDNSIDISWKNPSIVNGILNSFLINVEEISTMDITECCKTYPNIEVVVKEEQLLYNAEIENLRPGATYVIGVVCKTTWYGPPANITVQTLTTPSASKP